MAGSAQFTVGSTAVLLASAPASSYSGPVGWVFISNGSGGSIYLGGSSAVSSANGVSIALSTTWSGYLFQGDTIYGVQNSGSSTVSVLQTGT